MNLFLIVAGNLAGKIWGRKFTRQSWRFSAKDIVLQHLNSKNIFGYETQFNVLYGKPTFPCS